MDIWMSGIMYQNGFAESTQGHFILGNVENDIFASSQFLECINWFGVSWYREAGNQQTRITVDHDGHHEKK